MSLQTVARRYALALADVIVERGEAKEVQDELLRWGSMISSNPLLQEAFNNPTIPYEQKRNLLGELIAKTGVRQTTANFLQVLLRNQRLGQLSEVNEKLAQLLDERAGVVAVEVIAARSMSPASAQSVQGKLASLTGKKVRVTFHTDAELIGGLVVRIGSTIYDGSIRNQLDEMGRILAGS